MKMMVPLVKECIDRMVGKVTTGAEKKESVDLIDLYRKMTMEVILSTAFGRSIDVQTSDGGELYKAADTLFSVLDPEQQGFGIRMIGLITLLLPQYFSAIELLRGFMGVGKALDFLSASVLEIIKLRRQQKEQYKRTDLLQLMIDACDEETKSGLTNGEIVADCVEFLLAGYETTGSALTFTTHLLATHQDVQERLAAEIQEYFVENENKSIYEAIHELVYLDMVFCEALRMYPPLPTSVYIESLIDWC